MIPQLVRVIRNISPYSNGPPRVVSVLDVSTSVNRSSKVAISGTVVGAVVVVVLILVAAAAYLFVFSPASAVTVSSKEYIFTNYDLNSTTTTNTTSIATAANAVQVDIPSDNGYPFAQYTPQVVVVVIGVNNTVTWTNHDQIVHNILTTSGLFSSGDLAYGQTYTFTFTQPGTFAYYCSYHPSMAGVVIVRSH